MELEEPTEQFRPIHDPRPHLPEPPPVRLISVGDVRLSSRAGLEKQLDDFYVALLRFERDLESSDAPIVYRAERYRVLFDVVEVPPARDDYRPLQLASPHFGEVVQGLIDREIDYEWQRGVVAGLETILLQDPAGNWVSVEPVRPIP